MAVSPAIQSAPGVGPCVSPQPGINIPLVALADASGQVGSGAGAAPTGATLTAQSALSTVGAAVDLGAVRAFPVAQVVASAGVSAGAVQLQGSLDGTSWYPVATGAGLTAPGVTSVSAAAGAIIPARFVRGFISTGIVGGTVTVAVGGA